MTNKSKKSINLKLCGIFIALIAVIVVIVITTVINTTQDKPLDDSFFVSDGTKYSVTIDNAAKYGIRTEWVPKKLHVVYFYSGDKVTDLKYYYEYQEETDAESAADSLKDIPNEDPNTDSVVLDGKYVIVTINEYIYEDLTPEDAKWQIEYLQSEQNEE